MYISGKVVLKGKHLFALPMSSTFVLLSKKYVEKIEKLLKETGGIKKFVETTEEKRDYFYRLKSGKKCSLKFLFILYGYLFLDLKELESNVIQIVSGKNNSVGIDKPKLPFQFNNKDGGRFLGAIMGDGSRTKLGGLIYNNKDEGLVKLILKSAKKVLGEVKYRLTWKKDGTLQLDLPKIAGDIVGLFGIERGSKTKTDCYVELKNFSKDMKLEFVRQFFSDEGNVRLSDRRLQVKQSRKLKGEISKKTVRERVDRFAPRVLKEIRGILEGIGIKSTISLETLREDRKGDFSLNIYVKENLEKFREKVGFNLEYKNKLLERVINSYIYPSSPRNGRINFALEKARKVEKKRGYITKILLSKESQRSLKTAAYFLVDLKKKGLIKVIEKPRKESGTPLPQKYVLVK